LGFLKRLHTFVAPSAAGVAVKSTGGIAENDGRAPMTDPYTLKRVSQPGGRGNPGSVGAVAGLNAFATQSDLSPSGVGGNTYLPWVGALTAQSGAYGPVMQRREDTGPGLQHAGQGGQPWELPPLWTYQLPGPFTNIADMDSGWQAINAQAAPARIPHQFRPALRMNATLHSHGQGENTGSLSGINSSNAIRPPANLLGGNSVSRFPRSVRLPSGTGATANGAGTAFVPAVFVPRGVQ
jgi:hypothetical protein